MQGEASELMVCPPVGELRVQAFRKHVTLEKSTMSETEGFTTCSLWRNLLSGIHPSFPSVIPNRSKMTKTKLENPLD